MDVFTWAALIALSVKTVSFIKSAAPQLTGWQTQGIAWVVTIAYVFLGAEVQGIQTSDLNGIQLQAMELWDKVYVGLAVGSVGSLVGNDVLRAVDNNSKTSV